MDEADRPDQRASARYRLGGDVRLRLYPMRAEGDVCEVEAELLDAGRGGLRARAAGPELPLGALADLEIGDASEPEASTLSLVRWTEPGGMVGLEFFYATEEDRVALEHYLRSRCEQAAGPPQARRSASGEGE